MGIGKRIKEARLALNMTQEDLAKKLNVTKGAVANYENETSHPKEPIMYKLIDVLEVDANYLFQDVVNVSPKKNDVTLAEFEHIKKYRSLDEHGKKMVDIVLDEEYSRCKDAKKISEEPSYLRVQAAHERTDIEVTDDMRKHDDDIMNDPDF